MALSALGQRQRSRHWHEFTGQRVRGPVPNRDGHAGIDGEAVELATPIRFRIHPGGLRLLLPEDNLLAAERRRGRDVSVRDLFALAAGRDPLAQPES